MTPSVAGSGVYIIGPAEILAIFFVTPGPLKILGPFVQRTHDLDDRTLRKVALWAFALATITVMIGSLVGAAPASIWQISIGALTLTAGIIFFVIALNHILEQHQLPHAPVAPPPLPPSPMAVAVRLLFPIVLTPYGIAAAIVRLAGSRGTAHRSHHGAACRRDGLQPDRDAVRTQDSRRHHDGRAANFSASCLAFSRRGWRSTTSSKV